MHAPTPAQPQSPAIEVTPPPVWSQDALAHAALDNFSAMVAYWDATLHCRFANRAYERWFGVTPEDMIGMHIADLLGPLYRLNLPYIEGVLRGEPQEFERDIPDPKGGPARASLATYIPDVADGKVRGFFVHVSDVSALKRTERALREVEEQFRLTLDEAPIGMALVGPEGRFLRVNNVLCELLGYRADELVGMTFQAVTHPEDLDKDLSLAGQLGRGEIPRYTLEKRYIRKDGSIVDIELNGSALRSPEGRLIHFIAQVEDISQRKRMEAEQQFLGELGPVLAATLDEREIAERLCQLVTQRMADFCIVNFHRSEGKLMKVVACRDPRKRELADALLRLPLDVSRPHLAAEALRQQRPVVVQRPSPQDLAAMTQGPEHLRAVQALDVGSMLAAPLAAAGRVLGAIVLIASRGSGEFDGRHLRFVQEVAWRSASALANARLYQEARDATRLREEVLAIVAHDLRNPLNIISLQAGLLRRRAQPRAGAEGVAGDAIQRATTRMNRLIEDLLDMSRIESGRLWVAPAVVAAMPFLRELVESQQGVARAAGIELALDVPPDVPGLLGLPDLWADRDRLSQVFENLIGNALKFSPGGRITVGARSQDSMVQFWVRDTGSGIPPEQLPHVFDRFWQARRADREGAGLGLPIVKGIVEAHGGEIRVESQSGQGTAFFFTIPVARAGV